MMNEPLTFGSALTETTVGEAMHHGVLTCPPETPLRDVARMLARFRVHAVVVFTDDDDDPGAPRLWGIVSDSDLMAAAALDDVGTRTAGGTATTPLVTITRHETLKEAAALMREDAVTHLVVVSPATERPVGVISTLDIARAIALEPEFHA
jgi:CBS domain-containing protein